MGEQKADMQSPSQRLHWRSLQVGLLGLILAVDVHCASPAIRWKGTTVRDLWGEYGNIFRHGNRNAASHLWSAFLLDRSAEMPLERFNQLMGGYCAVSGSPVTPADRTRYRMSLEQSLANGSLVSYITAVGRACAIPKT